MVHCSTCGCLLDIEPAGSSAFLLCAECVPRQTIDLRDKRADEMSRPDLVPLEG